MYCGTQPMYFILSLPATVPEIFARGLQDHPLNGTVSFVDAALRKAELALELVGGVSDAETNCICLLRSLAVRVGYAVIEQRLIVPMESFRPDEGAGKNARQRSETKRSGNIRTHATTNWTVDALRGDAFGVCIHCCEDKESYVRLQTYNISSGYFLCWRRGEDSPVTEAISKILEAAPIPASVVAEESTDVRIAVSKNSDLSKTSKMSAKMRRRHQVRQPALWRQSFCELEGAICPQIKSGRGDRGKT